MIKINKIFKNKRTQKLIITITTIMSCIMLLYCISGCTLFDLINETFTGEREILESPKVEIDEAEIKEIGKSDVDIRKSYDIESEISLIDESVRDPFRPFYIQDDDKEEEKNILKLVRIFSKDGIEYSEVNLNDYTYKLKEGDTLSDNYLVQAININSVVLLKGDEVLTLFMDIPVYD